jgi:hypothetical protein
VIHTIFPPYNPKDMSLILRIMCDLCMRGIRGPIRSSNTKWPTHLRLFPTGIYRTGKKHMWTNFITQEGTSLLVYKSMHLNFYCRLSNFVSVLQEEQGTFLLHTSCNFDSQITLKNGILINIVSISVFSFWVLGRSFSAFLASFKNFDVPVKLFNAIKPPVQF